MKVASGRLRGVRLGTATAFLGIPFAQAPVGELRFAAPVPPAPWPGVRDATAYGPTADRVAIPDHIMPETVVPGDAILNLNVFTPDLAASGLPVLVWIHGGGFLSGSPKNGWYEGESFTRDGVVVVTVDYRLGFQGFGLIEGAPDNRGVLDWLAALEWVRDNIAAFGGDPARVTIAGQSAGGGAVLTLLGLPKAQDLFRAAICLSGAVADVPRERAAAFAHRLAARARVPADLSGFSALTEKRLLRLQTERIRGSLTRPFAGLGTIRALLTGVMSLGPVIDGDLLDRPTLDSLAAGVGADKPLLVVTVDDELTADMLGWLPAMADLLLRTPLPGLSKSVARAYRAQHPGLRARRLLGRLATDQLFRRLALETVDARAAAPNWLARVSWPSPTTGDARHCVDLPFFFDALASPKGRVLAGDAPQRLADELHGAAVRLLHGQEPEWERWTPDRRATRVFGATIETEPDGYRDVRVLSDRLSW